MEVDNLVLNNILDELKEVNSRLKVLESYEYSIDPKIVEEMKLREKNPQEWLSKEESNSFFDELKLKLNNG